MKKMINLIALGATVAVLALPVAAKSLTVATVFSDQDQCSQEAKDAMYAAFRESRTTDQVKAYDNAKKYLACPAGEATEAQQKIIDYLKKWVGAYEEGMKKAQYRTLLYNDQKYPEAYAAGKSILATEPENLKVLVDLGVNGYLLVPLKNASLMADAVGYATKALALLESGKTLDDWQPLASKDVAIAYLNYTIGTLTLEKDPASALKNLIKAAQFETPLKKSPYTYAYIAGAYETGPYAKMSEAYKAQFSGKDETPESKLALANVNQIVDRMVDGYARAVALATDPKFADQKKGWSESLSQWYKYRHNGTDTGMNEMLASILSQPLPPEPTPLTSLPTPAPATSPASGAASPSGTTTSATSPTSSQANTTGTANKTNTPTTGTKSTPTAGAKPKNNHRP